MRHNPKQSFGGQMGYRIHLGWRDRLRVVMGASLLVSIRFASPIPIRGLRTVSSLLVGGGHPHKDTTMDVETPKEAPDGAA